MRQREIRLLVAFLLFELMGAAPLLAQRLSPESLTSACGQRKMMAETLVERYHEVRIASGLEKNGHLIEVFASADGQTWTILATQTNDKSCVLAVGEYFSQYQALGSKSSKPASAAEIRAFKPILSSAGLR